MFEFARGPSPVLLCVADNATRAGWLFEHLTREYELLRNPDDEDRKRWVTIQVDSKVFDADKGNEAVLREMVNTVGRKGRAGEDVRCIVSVNMLSEGWDVQSVSHILGLRAFGSPLLTEQIIGRGLRRTNYDVLNQPLEERPEGSEETVDAFGIPFVGFPVEKRKRPKTGEWGQKPIWIEPDAKKEKFRVRVPNVRSWAVGVIESLADLVRVEELPEVRVNPKETPPDVHVRPVVGGQPEAIMTLEEFRKEWPLLKTAFLMAEELFEATNPGSAADLGIGPTFDELLDLSRRFLNLRVRALEVDGRKSDLRDVGIYYWRRQVLDVLENAVRSAGLAGDRTRADPWQPRLARFGDTATVPVDRSSRRWEALPHEQGAVPHRPREAVRRVPRPRQRCRSLLQERALRVLRDLLRRQSASAVLPGLHRRCPRGG